MHDDTATACGRHDIVLGHGVPPQIKDAIALFPSRAQAALQGLYLPPGVTQLSGDFTADTACRTKYQGSIVSRGNGIRHVYFSARSLILALFWARHL